MFMVLYHILLKREIVVEALAVVLYIIGGIAALLAVLVLVAAIRAVVMKKDFHCDENTFLSC